MGSNNYRKNNDAVRIPRPLSASDGSGTVGGDGGGLGDDFGDTNHACPVTFRVKLRQIIPSNIRLSLEDDGSITWGTAIVGSLSVKKRLQVERCATIGVHYQLLSQSSSDGLSCYAQFQQRR